MRQAAAVALGVEPETLCIVPSEGIAEVADATRKFAVRDLRGSPLAFATCSVALSPDLVARACAGARMARGRLAKSTGDVILAPLAEGYWHSLSWALLPWADPLPDGRVGLALVRQRLRPALLRWLRQVTRETRHSSTPARHAQALASLAQFGGELEHAAATAARRFAQGAVPPTCVLTHGDLWLGNVLLPHGIAGLCRGRFVVIDWPGADGDGFAIYDLIRLAASLHVSPRRLRAELRDHADLLGCALEDTRVHLLAALGDLASRLESFPRERFQAMAIGAWRRIEAAIV